eukprot:CAMPEP_0185761032 /NCGR_PEP_ID=MMETSP1174-20130828/19932_1 /TAXON_ID=35687 /ORGANISM="Dictyocha speculum, Strain CCMP1381" /LENGTH=421 /DNA_ID=CAMNT_0028442083 /DNA_START=143 /DNA_END=1408 /DNA_ORIENTATION=+
MIILMEAAGRSLTTVEDSLLDSAALMGAILGMIIFGQIGDNVGRHTGLLFALVTTTTGSFLAGTLGCVPLQIGLHVVMGVGLGGTIPLSAAMAFEDWDVAGASRSRDDMKEESGALVNDKKAELQHHSLAAMTEEDYGVAEMRVAYANYVQTIGKLLLYLLAYILVDTPLPYYSQWRLLNVMGGVVSLPAIGMLLHRGLNESQEFVRASRERERVRRDVYDCSFLKRVKAEGYLGTLGACALYWFFFNVVTYGLAVYAPEIVEDIIGTLSVRQDILLMVLITVVSLVSALTSLPIIRYFQARRTLILGMGLSAIAFAVMGAIVDRISSASQITLICIVIYCVQLPGIAVFIVPATLFPTHLRAGCHGAAAAVAKVGAVIGAFGTPIVIDYFGVAKVFEFFAACLLICFFVVIYAVPVRLIE